MQNETNNSTEVLYKENTKVAQVFWEWRHKVITAYVTGFSGVLFVAGWLLESKNGFWWSATIPFVLGIFFTLACYRLDRSIVNILEGCYQVGADLERRLLSDAKGIYQYLRDRQPPVRFAGIFLLVYRSAGVLLFLLGVLVLVYACLHRAHWVKGT